MRNVMLGHSGDGKTTFVASAYAMLQQQVNGFTITARDASDHRQLMTLAKAISRGTYPPPTAVRSEYDFSLNFEREPVMDFSWADYRGGALMDTTDAQDTARLRDDLQSCDGIQVFVDASAIASGRKVRSQIGRITNLIGAAIADVEHRLPLAIVLTKCDLVPESQQNASLIDPIRGLIDAVKASRTVPGTLIPVACGPHSDKVELPVLFVLKHALVAKALALKATRDAASDEFDQLETEIAELDERHSMLSSYANEHPIEGFFDKLFGGRNAQDRANEVAIEFNMKLTKAREAAEIANSHLSQFLPLTRPAEALEEYLKDLISF